jgi:glucose uptake protein GlcU
MNAMAIENERAQPGLLRRALQADFLVTGSACLLLTLAAGPVGDLFDLPVALLRIVGFALLPYTAFVVYVATRTAIPRRGAWAIVVINLVWAVASLVLLVSGWVDPSGLGIAFVVAQALIVAGFADVQFLGLRRSNG